MSVEAVEYNGVAVYYTWVNYSTGEYDEDLGESVQELHERAVRMIKPQYLSVCDHTKDEHNNYLVVYDKEILDHEVDGVAIAKLIEGDDEDTEDCIYCGGAGKLNGLECDMCNGEGKVEVREGE